VNFEWNEEKAESNLKKHGVPFDEAKTVFDDPLFVIFAIPTIRLKKIVLSLWARQIKTACLSFPIRNDYRQLA